MPLKQVDYSKTHFYKIVCNDLTIKDCYVGHTTNFKNRKNAHKTSHYNSNGKTYNGKNNNRYVYNFIADHGGWDNWDMILINTEYCENALDAKKKEREYIELLNATLNEKRPYISKEDKAEYKAKWAKDNEEQVKRNKHDWYIANKEHCNQKSKQKYEEHKDERKKQSREKYAENREHYLKQHKEYYNNNKAVILQNEKDRYHSKKDLVECECGCKVFQHNLREHQETRKHKQYIDFLQGNKPDAVQCSCGAIVLKKNLRLHQSKQKHQDYLNNQASEEHTEEFLQTTQDN